MKTIDEIVQRLRAKYIDMPGLALTAEQVQRLCGIEHHVCRSVLDTLVNAQFLATGPNGEYARRTEDRKRGRPPSSTARSVNGENRRLSGHGGSDVLQRQEGIASQRGAAECEGGEGPERPERRRARSDLELRANRTELEREWKDRD